MRNGFLNFKNLLSNTEFEISIDVEFLKEGESLRISQIDIESKKIIRKFLRGSLLFESSDQFIEGDVSGSIFVERSNQSGSEFIEVVVLKGIYG